MEIKQLLRLAPVLLLVLPCAPLSASLPDRPPAFFSSEQKFAQISSLVGTWDVKDRSSLTIVFETTAGGSVVVEKWMRGTQVHSLTIYHLDGDAIIATHYCPQGNQPRLAASGSFGHDIRFTFQDITGLDAGESYQHNLRLAPQKDGSLIRSEIYWGVDGAGEESEFILTRSED